MKNILILVLGICNTLLYAQNSRFCGEVNYTYTTNIAYFYQEEYKMVFNDSICLSEEINIKASDAQLVKENNDGMLTQNIIGGRKNTTPAFYYKKNQEFYFSQILDEDYLIVKEDEFIWNWTLTNEYKKIGTFNCSKAIIKFRGRIYHAWYTSEIPVQYGPWKFQGLPGLIIEVYDEDRYFVLQANEIIIRQNIDCKISIDFKELSQAMSISEYLKAQKEFVKRKFAIISSKLPKGAKPLVLDENCDDCNSNSLEIFNE